jgi:hypothetical protein
MEHADYVYTTGMDEAEIEETLRSGTNAVLALADDGEAYAIPLNYHYDGDRLLLRVSTHGELAAKERFLRATDTATLVCHEVDEDGSWSILVRGPVREWAETVDEETLNDWFPPFRLFDEAVEDVRFSLYELEMETVIGRRTVG